MSQNTRLTIERSIARILQRVDELRALDLSQITDEQPPNIIALSASIEDTLERAFKDRPKFLKRYSKASEIFFFSGVYTESYPQIHHYKSGTKRNVENAIALLEGAKAVLVDDLDDIEHSGITTESEIDISGNSRVVFVVHGHDDASREAVARFLEKIQFTAVILHEQANQGKTIIEKIESHSDVGFAIVILSPDDLGGKKGEEQKPRARQNVLLELGYFIGRLGRKRVCALMVGKIDIPSDFAGAVWVPFDSSNGWQIALAKELRALGYEIDFNRIIG
jgi:predicted nucleotide-binding protein